MAVQTTQTPRGYTPGNVAQAQDAAVFERAGAGIYLTVEWITAYIQAALGNGTAITFGSTPPANTVGEQDDVFFNIATGEVLRKGASTWTAQANFALDTEVTTAITAAITAHAGATDPHPIYLTQAEATALFKPLTTDDGAGTGLRLTLLTATTGTPASGQIIANSATLSSITQLQISETDRNGAAIDNIQNLLADTLRIQVQNEQSEDIYCYFRVNGAPTDSGTYRTVPVTFVSKPTAITTLTQLAGTGEVTIGLFGGANTSAGVTIREIDGTPTGTLSTLEVPNSSLSDQGSGVFRLTFPTTAPGGGGLTYSTQSANANIAEGQAFVTSGTSDLSFTAPAGTVAGQPLGVFRNDAGNWSLLMPAGATVFGSGNNSSIAGIKSLSAEARAYATLKALAPNVWKILDSEGIEFMASVVNLVPVMTANNAPSPFVASASSAFSGFDAFRAFDGTNSTAWAGVTQDTTPETLTINLGASKAVHYVTIRSRSDVTDQYPRDFTIQTSANGTSFTTQLTLTNQVFSAGQVRTYTFPAPVNCQFVQVNINNIGVGGGYYKAIAELGIFGI